MIGCDVRHTDFQHVPASERLIVRQSGWPTAPSVRDGCPEQLVALTRVTSVRRCRSPLFRAARQCSRGEASARRAPDQGHILSRTQRRHKTPMHRRPSKITIVTTGSTVVTAAAAAGVVALWPATAPGVSTADSLTAGSASSAQQAGAKPRLGGSDALASHVLFAGAPSVPPRPQSLSGAAQLAAARRGAEPRTA